jgi:hypothetical protein
LAGRKDHMTTTNPLAKMSWISMTPKKQASPSWACGGSDSFWKQELVDFIRALLSIG